MNTLKSFEVVFDSQRIFQLLLDAMARPGKMGVLPEIKVESPVSMSAYPVIVLLTLIDLEVTFSLIDSSRREAEVTELSDYIAHATGSLPKPAAEADFIAIYGGRSEDGILQAKRGSLNYPDTAATVIYDVVGLNDGDNDSITLELTGPGIEGATRLSINGLEIDEVRLIIESRGGFPLGPDIIITDRNGRVACLPRSTTINIRS